MATRSEEHDDRLMTIVAAASQVPANDRDDILLKACRQDTELRREVDDILEWEDRMGSFLGTPLIELADVEDFETLFCSGDILSDRFEIIREIGHGGMGVVYQAFDRRRNCRIAIKASKDGFRHLLSPELEGALKVRHPNICLVNEIHTSLTTCGKVEFLTMELLEGETLSARLRREGRLSSIEALEIGRQLCAGLAEAHRSEIIHRDLKTSNIILVHTEGRPIRAVITDFGLAGSVGLDREQFGTARYMAPELLQGERTSKASDIYALGVILHELVTGEEPVAEGERIRFARPGRNSLFVWVVRVYWRGKRKPEGDSRWDKVIRQCLNPTPKARPNSDQVLSLFDKRPAWKSTLLFAFLIALIALGMALSTTIRVFFKPPDMRLAFLPVEAPADLAGIGNGVLHDVVDQINRSQRAGATVIAMPISETVTNNVRTPREAKTILNATHAMHVKLSHQGENIEINLVVTDLVAERHIRDFAGTYSKATMGGIPNALTGALRAALRLQAITTDSLSAPATVAYDHGLSFLRQDDDSFSEAIPLFQTAARLDPRSPLPLAELAEAEILRFEATRDHSALEEAGQALGAAESLNPDSVAVRLVSGLLEKTQGQYDRALEDYRRVQELEPRNLDAILRTASVYVALDDPDSALACYRKAIALEPAYYGSYQKLGRFYYYSGKYEQAAAQFQNTIQRAPGLYVAYNELGAALDYLGRDSEAEQALLASLKLKETASALNSLGGINVYQKHDAEAVKYYQRAVRIDPLNYVYLLNLGDSDRRLARRIDAAAAYSEAWVLALAELKEDPRKGMTRSYVAYLAARLGKKQRAEEEIAQARHSSPDDKMVLRKAVLTYEALGERDQAIDALRGATPDGFRELGRHPDLADFRTDLRFKQLESRIAQQRK